jgi:hypothetical protein
MRIIRFLIEFLIYIEELLKKKPIKKEPIKLIKFIKQYKKYMKLIKFIKQYIKEVHNIKDPNKTKPNPIKGRDKAENGAYGGNYRYITENDEFKELSMKKDENNKYILSKSSIEHCKMWDKNDNEIKFKKINPNNIALNLLENYYPKIYITEGYSIPAAFNKISMVVDHNNFKIDLCIKLSNNDIIYYKNF